MNKKLLGLALIILLYTGKVTAQQTQDTIKPSVEKEVAGLQIGRGVWAYYEFKLANQFTLRTEAGLKGGYWFKISFYGDDDFDQAILLVPVIKAEPRWYYNLNRRIRKGRDIKGNRGNFIALSIAYAPDWFIIDSNSDYDFYKRSILSIVPTWGIRRTLGKHFDYEVGIGIGYGYAFKYTKNGFTYKAQDGPVGNLHLRIGYHF